MSADRIKCPCGSGMRARKTRVGAYCCEACRRQVYRGGRSVPVEGLATRKIRPATVEARRALEAMRDGIDTDPLMEGCAGG